MTKASTDVAAKANNALPAHLQGGKKQSFGNIDQTDLIVPRVKLLQGISPEVEQFDNAKSGEFWHTIAGESMGKTIKGVPILVRKTYALWAPRGDDRGILARASDGVNWDQQFRGLKFTVKPKNYPHEVTYQLGDSVHDKIDGNFALSEFGSSIPGDPQSAPAAALTYQFLWYFPDAPDLSPALIINTRSSVKPAKQLISKIELRPVDSFAQVFDMSVVSETNNDGDKFYNYAFTAAGYADEETFKITSGLYERYNSAEFRANDESEDADKGESGGGTRSRSGPSESDKF